jgi:hypothetical protein
VVDKRSIKALGLKVRRLSEGLPLFDVSSGSGDGSTYRVLYEMDGTKNCSCDDWKFQSRKREGEFKCKHIRAVENQMAQELLGDGIVVVAKEELKDEG